MLRHTPQGNMHLRSSPTGPALHWAGGSRPRSCSSCLRWKERKKRKKNEQKLRLVWIRSEKNSFDEISKKNPFVSATGYDKFERVTSMHHQHTHTYTKTHPPTDGV